MPEAPNGEASRLYRDLFKRLSNRRLANFIYSVYRTNNTADAMDKVVDANGNPRYIRNKQGEHSIDDVMDFLDVNTMLSESNDITMAERQLGSIDSNGNRVDFTDAEVALTKAKDFNENHKGLVATVDQHGDVFNIIVNEKNSRTLDYADNVNSRLEAWSIYKQAFSSIGIDPSTFPAELQSTFNPMNVDLAVYLNNLSHMAMDNIYKKEAMILLSMSPNTRHVQNAINRFGSVENAAQAIDDVNHGNQALSSNDKRLLNLAIKEAQKLQGLDANALATQVSDKVKDVVDTSPYKEVREEVHKLNKKYHIEINEIHRINDDIRTLSDAAAEATIVLQREIRKLERMKGTTAESKRLSGILNELMKELNTKKYYSGVMKFLNEASTQISEIDNILNNIPQSGTEIERAIATATAIQRCKEIISQYSDLVSALSNEHLTIDESISKDDIDNIRQSAENLRSYLDKKIRFLNDLSMGSMSSIMVQIVGDKTPDGVAMASAIRMGATDSGVMNFLYSVGRANNPIIGAMGSIIRGAQDSRDSVINGFSERIRRATDTLYKAGHNTEFMYEDDGHIASDIDWNSYESARRVKFKEMKDQGLWGFDLKRAMETWEAQNTEERVVDNVNGRTERVPNKYYRKVTDFQEGWSDAQKKYYDTMMQLKGEIGSLLPAYAQKQYLPPQLRRKFLDAMNDASNAKDVGKAILNKLENFYKVREDDENYAEKGIISDGEEYGIADSNSDGTPIRQIPIFFVNTVEQGELLKNFSTGIQALAGTAVNYAAMNKVVDVVEFMRDFAVSQMPVDKNAKVDVVKNNYIQVIKNLRSRSKNSNTAALMDGFISQHIYGQHLSPNENRILSKIWGNIIAYTSFKGLATNIKGAVANYLMGEFQMMLEAGCGEFYGFKDYGWAHTKLFGKSGVAGDMAELLTNNMSHKATLMREKFDPLNENFSDKSHKNYYTSMFRQLLSHDCSFIGYSSGEYLIHYVNMYAILHREKVKLGGKTISLFDAYELTDKVEGNASLRLKNGVTDLDGNPLTKEYEDNIRRRIRYCNHTCHGAMNTEDKGLIHQRMMGRAVMNFRQWMVEHYSRRFRGLHFDATLGEMREGYYTSLWKALLNEDTKETWKKGNHAEAVWDFMTDLMTFTFRSSSQWHNLNDMQKYNIKRARAEFIMFIALSCLSFALGEPDEHKKEFWRRFFIYQTKRALMDTEVSMPNPQMFGNALTVINSPMASVNTVNSLLYAIYGLYNGDLNKVIKSGDHAGENRYLRNMIKYNMPFYKDYEQMKNFDTDESIFKVLEPSPANH